MASGVLTKEILGPEDGPHIVVCDSNDSPVLYCGCEECVG